MALSQSAKLGFQTALSCGRFVARTLLAGTSYGGGLVNAPVRRRHLLSALSGFPKDLRYGASTVLRTDGFGDDACFIARHSSADVVGVADGVGGWRTYGVDPSRFSRSLMKVCAQLVNSGQFEPGSPAGLIAASYKHLYDEQVRGQAEEVVTGSNAKHGRVKRGTSSKPLVGSSTACVVVLDRTKGCIHTANIGDSGFLIVRDGKVVHRSREQQHYFNAPFQLSIPLSVESSSFLCDSPESAETTSFDVKEGDLIVLATDGLFDNMPTQLIENELNTLQQKQLEKEGEKHSDDDEDEQRRRFTITAYTLQQACNSLAFQARQLAMDCNHMSPFAQKAQEHGIADAMGGKPDDITLILALVTSQNLERVDEEGEYELSTA